MSTALKFATSLVVVEMLFTCIQEQLHEQRHTHTPSKQSKCVKKVYSSQRNDETM